MGDPPSLLQEGSDGMTTAQQIFESAMALMDSLSDSGAADTADNAEYKARTLAILNLLRGELYPYSDTYEAQDGGRATANLIRDFTSPVNLDDYICQSVMPCGLAAHLLLTEDPATANFFQQRYDELKATLARGLGAVSEDIADVYGEGWAHNDYGAW